MSKNNANDFDDDLPPDLEDIPEDILSSQPNNKSSKAGTGNINLGDYAKPKPEVESVQPPPKEEQKKPEVFGGLKKGFFSAESKPKAVTQPKKEKSDIIEVKPTNKKDSKVLDEVQEAMKVNQTLLDKKQEWMTPDLLSHIAANPKLTKLFTNPEYMQAISLMQTNPKEAMQRYGNNPEFKELLLEFSQIMGGHFEKMGQKAPAQGTQGGAAGGKVMDARAEEILKDPKIIKVIQYLQKNPQIDFKQLMYHDPDLAEKLRYLISKGYFQLQS